MKTIKQIKKHGFDNKKILINILNSLLFDL